MKRLYQAAIPSSIHNKGAFHFQRSNLYYSDSISSAIGKDSLVIVSVVHAHIPWKRTVRPRYVWGAQCFQTELIPSHNMIEMQLQCVNREVSQRSPRIQDIAALYLFHTKILRCKILYVFSHSIIYHTVWYFSTYLLSYSNFNNEYAQSPITLHLWHIETISISEKLFSLSVVEEKLPYNTWNPNVICMTQSKSWTSESIMRCVKWPRLVIIGLWNSIQYVIDGCTIVARGMQLHFFGTPPDNIKWLSNTNANFFGTR